MSEHDKFWLVWNGCNISPPTLRHESRGEAINEATRLARKELGTFYVLEADVAVYPAEPAITQKTLH